MTQAVLLETGAAAGPSHALEKRGETRQIPAGR